MSAAAGLGPLPAPSVGTAHDVRSLRVCACGCKQLGDRRHMISQPRGAAVRHFHGRCFIKSHGMVQFLRLPQAELGKCSLADIGLDAMKAVLDRWQS